MIRLMLGSAVQVFCGFSAFWVVQCVTSRFRMDLQALGQIGCLTNFSSASIEHWHCNC